MNTTAQAKRVAAEARLTTSIQDIYMSAFAKHLPIDVIRDRLRTEVYETKAFGSLNKIMQYGIRMYDRAMMRQHQLFHTQECYNFEGYGRLIIVGAMSEEDSARYNVATRDEALNAYGYYYRTSGKPFETEEHKA
jgi:hypothetical protein